MQFKLLAATLLASSVAGDYANYMDCLVKKKCWADKVCVQECFQIEKDKPEEALEFNRCAAEICVKEGDVPNKADDYTKFYECLPKCYNEWIGRHNGTQVDLDAKASDKKEEEKKDGGKKEEEKKEDDKESDKKDEDKKEDGNNATANNTTTTKPPAPAPAPTSNAFKTVPSVVAFFILAALAL